MANDARVPEPAGMEIMMSTFPTLLPQGMLPGYISGFYTNDDCHIDLARLAAFCHARLIHHEAAGIDVQVTSDEQGAACSQECHAGKEIRAGGIGWWGSLALV